MTALRVPRRRSHDSPAPSEGTPILAIENVRLSYGESVVSEEVSLVVRPGQVVALMGRNGAGKTTLLKAVVGILRPQRGSIVLDGGEITRWPSYARARAGIGYVPQGRGIFPYLTVLENLLIGLEPIGGKDSGQLDEVFSIFPVLKQMSGRTAGVLSGGQQQQLAIGRALAGRPR